MNLTYRKPSVTNSIKYKKGYKYQTGEDYICKTGIVPCKDGCADTDYLHLDPIDQRLTIKKGYAWDGPSGPTLDTKNSLRASLEHDAKHQLMCLGLVDRGYLQLVDAEFKKTLREDGMSRLRSWIWVKALRSPFGAKARPSDERLTLSAP